MDHGTKIKLDLKKQYYYNNTKTHSKEWVCFLVDLSDIELRYIILKNNLLLRKLNNFLKFDLLD